MIKAKIANITFFDNFLSIINKFVPQCQFIVSKEKTSAYCKNPSSFASSRLLLDTNILTLDQTSKYDSATICIRNIIAFKSALSIVKEVEDIKELTLDLDEVEIDNAAVVKSIKYKSNKGGSFNIITIDFDVIKEFVSKDAQIKLQQDWIFNVNTRNLDLMQSKTNGIVNLDDVSVYIYPKDDKAIIELTSKKSASVNSIALPLADSFKGSLDNADFKEIAIHESSFRIFNILKVVDPNDIICFFNIENNIFFVTSVLKADNLYVKSRLFIQMVKGK